MSRPRRAKPSQERTARTDATRERLRAAGIFDEEMMTDYEKDQARLRREREARKSK